MARTEEIAAEFKGKIVRAISKEFEGESERIRIEFQDGTALLIELKADEAFVPINEYLEINSIH